MITVTNNYFKDLASAIEAGLFRPGPKPKKAELYKLIEAHNAAQSPEVVEAKALEEVAIQDELLAMDALEDAEPVSELEQLKAEFDAANRDYQFGFASGDLKAQKEAAKRRSEALKKIQAIKKQEVDAAMATERKQRKAVTKTEKPKREKKSLEDYIEPGQALKCPKPGSKAEQEIELLRHGATKEEMMEALGWSRWHYKFSAVLKYGYGLRRDGEGRCFLVEPNDDVAVG